jgi:hypothetical protein
MSINLSCLPQSKALLDLYDDVSETEVMGRMIPPVSRSIDLLSDTLYDKCMVKLTGANKLAELLDGVMANTISPRPHSFDSVMGEIGNSFDSFEPALLKAEPFEMQPFEWPRYLDRSCMVNIDVTQVP